MIKKNNSKAELERTKRPYQELKLSEKQLLEFLECHDDPLYFMMNFMKVQHPMKGSVPFEPFEFQKKIIKGFHENRFCIVVCARQNGKALALDTPLPTPNGWTTMGEVQVGDELIGTDGKATKVSFATEVMHDHDCYEICFDNDETIIADADHLWTIGSGLFYHKPNKRVTLTTRELLSFLIKSKEARQSLFIDMPSALMGSHIDDLPVAPYTLGVWLGDDSIDREIFPNKHIPEIYLRASIEQRLALLQGLMDTSGYVKKRNRTYEIKQKSTQLADGIFELLVSLGIKVRRRIKVTKGQDYHRISFTIRKSANRQRIFIKSIKKTKSVPVKCIQVESDDHLFLCGKSMIPTHNTTCAAGYLLWKAMFTPDTTILVAANKFVQAKEIMDRIRHSYENMPDYIRAGIVEYNKSSISFDNGSRIISRATSPDAGRGLSISLLFLDEFAFVMPNKAKDFWTSMLPTLSAGGSCIIASTPRSDEDQFAQIWKGATNTTDEFGNERPDGLGQNNFFAIKATWEEHPERDKAWEKTSREQLGDARFEQEMNCSFVTDEATLIDPFTLIRLRSKQPIQYTGTVRWYKEPEPNHAYLVGLDPSFGVGGDDAAIQVFRMPAYAGEKLEQIAEWQHNKTAPRDQVRVLMQILVYLDGVLRDNMNQRGEPDIFWTVENNSLGEAILTVIEDTGEDRFPGSMISEKKRKGQTRRIRKGLNTTNKSKLSACARLKSLIESDRMVINSNNLIKELKGYVAKKNSFEAKPGDHDDLVAATLVVVRMLDMAIGWSGNAENLREYIDEDELIEHEPMPIAMSY